MAVAETELIARRMCSLVTKAAGEDPIGSVAAFDRLLLIEVPLPWPRAVRKAPRFSSDVDAVLQRVDASGLRYRMYGLVPDPRYTPEGFVRVIDVRRPETAAMTIYDKTDYVVPPAMLGDLVSSLLEQPGPSPAFDDFRQPTSHIRDLLVCTHGTRDRCCATFGYPVYNRLRRTFDQDESGTTRVWRVSHLGGHRFAPTVLDLPDGRNWAYLDQETTERLEQRSGDRLDLQRHYRGWAALSSLPEMVAERAAFEREGWRWLTRSVRSEIIRPTDPITERTVVRLSFAGPRGTEPGYYDVVVEPSGVVTESLGSCTDDKPRIHRQFHVTEITKNDLCRPRPYAMATAAE